MLGECVCERPVLEESERDEAGLRISSQTDQHI